MKHILPLITSLFFISCSGPEDPAEAPASTPSSEEAKSPSAPAPTVSTVAETRSPIFDPTVCRFLTEAQIKQTLGDQITDVDIQEAHFASTSGQKQFTLTLANGNPLNLRFRIEQSSVKRVNKLLAEHTDNAKTLPRMFKMEDAPDGQSYISTLIGHRWLYVFRPGQESIITLTYDERGAAGGKTPEEIEARRQMGLSLIKEILKE